MRLPPGYAPQMMGWWTHVSTTLLDDEPARAGLEAMLCDDVLVYVRSLGLTPIAEPRARISRTNEMFFEPLPFAVAMGEVLTVAVSAP